MRACPYCGGGIAETGEVTSWAGKWCHCIPNHKEQSRSPYDGKSVEEYMRQRSSIRKPSYSHIVNLCEQLTLPELKAIIGLLSQLHDSQSLASDAGSFKRRGE